MGEAMNITVIHVTATDGKNIQIAFPLNRDWTLTATDGFEGCCLRLTDANWYLAHPLEVVLEKIQAGRQDWTEKPSDPELFEQRVAIEREWQRFVAQTKALDASWDYISDVESMEALAVKFRATIDNDGPTLVTIPRYDFPSTCRGLAKRLWEMFYLTPQDPMHSR